VTGDASGNVVPVESVLAALREARAAEKSQTTFYRALAAAAEESGDPATAERINGLLADEQHHLSRITARLLEWGQPIPDVRGPTGEPDLGTWEPVAREREHAEIERYESLLELPLDDRTRRMIAEFLESERSHAESLGGKWMGA
jgi:rubrerythrin